MYRNLEACWLARECPNGCPRAWRKGEPASQVCSHLDSFAKLIKSVGHLELPKFTCAELSWLANAAGPKPDIPLPSL